MFKTVITLVTVGFVYKRTCPETYAKTVQALSDVVDITSDVVTTARGQIAAYTAEAAADASQRLQAVDPKAVEELRKLLG